MLDAPPVAYLLAFIERPPEGAVSPPVVAIPHQVVVIRYGVDDALFCYL